ncbi:MAG TPA: nucleotidyltransferase domain-containing protein [Longimicrobiales bacterium]|nr:nucleotidyltransferase domain-containing protein [Longimicrobiales bacterium]
MSLDLLLTSNALRRLIVHFVVHSAQRLHFRGLARHLDLSRQSLRNVLDQLASLGMIRPVGDGQRVVYERTDHPGWLVFAEMVRTFEDPAEVLRDLLSSVPGVHAAFIFGSFAKQTARADSDIDLFIVEEGVDARRLSEAVMEAGIALGRPVDVRRFTRDELQKALARKGTSYLKRVIEGPKRWVVGSDDALPIAA